MKQRIISGAVLILFCAAVVLFDQSVPAVLTVVVGFISLACIFELTKAMNLFRTWQLSVPAMAVAFAVPFVAGETGLLCLYAVFTALVFLHLVLHHKETGFAQVSSFYTMSILIPCALRCLVLLRDAGGTTGSFYVLAAVFAAWVADAGAYFAGTLFGKHKLCPEISPKKTVEGAIGGAVVNVILIMLGGFVFARFVYGGTVQPVYLALFLTGLLGSPISILGDLSFSLVKRSFHIKDFSKVIPGHGGILDRFDSVIFTAPFVYLLVQCLPLLRPM